MVRAGAYKGPLNLTWIGIGGGFEGPNPFNFFNFIHRSPDGCTLTDAIGSQVTPRAAIGNSPTVKLLQRRGDADMWRVAVNSDTQPSAGSRP